MSAFTSETGLFDAAEGAAGLGVGIDFDLIARKKIAELR